MAKTILTKDNIDYIKSHRFEMSGASMAAVMKVGRDVVNRYMRINGLAVSKELQLKFRAQGLVGRTSFTTKEDAFIKANYLTMPTKAIAEVLGRSFTGIKSRLRSMGLTIPTEIIELRKQQGRIQPGSVPANKGKKQAEYMSAEAIERTKATRFKKGNEPRTTLYDHAVTIRYGHKHRGGKPYKFIRLAKSKWLALQIFEWQKVNGKIPRGMCLWCKDGDTLNCDPSNWETITRAENMKRNSASLNLTDNYLAFTIAGKNHTHLTPIIAQQKNLIEVKRQQIILKRTIRKQNDTTTN